MIKTLVLPVFLVLFITSVLGGAIGGVLVSVIGAYLVGLLGNQLDLGFKFSLSTIALMFPWSSRPTVYISAPTTSPSRNFGASPRLDFSSARRRTMPSRPSASFLTGPTTLDVGPSIRPPRSPTPERPSGSQVYRQSSKQSRYRSSELGAWM